MKGFDGRYRCLNLKFVICFFRYYIHSLNTTPKFYCDTLLHQNTYHINFVLESFSAIQEYRLAGFRFYVTNSYLVRRKDVLQ